MALKDLDSLREHQARALEFVREQAKGRLDASLVDAELYCESPIEAMFALWWEAFRLADWLRIHELSLDPQPTYTIAGSNYRLDFAVTPLDGDMWAAAHDLGVKWQRIGVELDGHEFHERTREQVTHRNQRDRDFQNEGWKILHFSGSELYRDPIAVVSGVVEAGTNALNALTIGYSMAKFRAQNKPADNK